MINPEKIQALNDKMKELGIFEEDLVEKFVLGSGPGGQKVNKTSSTVFLQHIPTGIQIKCQKGRSRELNRYYARQLLCERFEESILKVETKRQQEIEKIRRQKRKRSKKAKEKMLEAKKKHSDVKEMRKPPSSEI